MKRTDLKVGAVLYHARPYEWTNDREGQKATVVAVEPYEWSSLYRKNTPTSKGNGVLVELPPHWYDESGTPRQEVVQLGHLRGPYETVKAEVDARVKARDERADAAKVARQAQHDIATELAERAKAAGLPSVRWAMDYRTDKAEFTVSTADLAELLAAYEAQQTGEG